MRKYSYLILILIALCVSNSSNAQLVGGNIYFPGAYLEIGMLNNGSFGAPAPPVGYFPYPAGTNLAEVYDQGHDGWTVGTPPYRGDYTYPGSPFEGWEIQVNGAQNQAFVPGGYFGSGSLTGAVTTYVNSGGKILGNWAGTAAGGSLVINQETRVDTLASAVVITTYFHNTGGTPATNLYYLRSCDPDNDEAHGGSFPINYFETNNTIVHQNEDATHKVMVAATGGLYSPDSTYIALATKDCRAMAFVYGDWSMSPTVDLGTVWSHTYTDYAFTYTLGANYFGDVAIALLYNLGTIAPGDSTVISYAYVFNGNNGINDPGALPDPQMVVNGDTIPNVSSPLPTIDTFNACTLPPGTMTVPVNLIFASDKDWTWSKWTWTPGTGLSTTTGTSVIVDLTMLGGPTTYTITGTDSSSGMHDCNNKMMILTILPCHAAFNNSPCQGDTLKLKDVGDSTGATYHWTGPGGFTSTRQNPFKYPATLADSGWYYVVKTVGTTVNPDSTHVTIHPKPVMTLSNNSPLCAGMVDTLNLGITPFTPGETFLWTGPSGYSSTLEFPQIVGLTPPVIPLGVYTVVATTQFGCKDTAHTTVSTVAQPPAPHGEFQTFCQFDTFTPFILDSLKPSAVVIWYPSLTGLPGSLIPTPVSTTIPGYDTVWMSQKVGSCESPRGNGVAHIITRPPAPIVSTPPEYCQFIGPILPLTVTHTASGVVRWYTTAVGGTFSLTEPIPNINIAGAYDYWVSQVDSGCESIRTHVTINVHPKPAPPIINPPHSICQLQTAGPMSATPSGSGDVLTWYGPGVTSGYSAAPVPTTDTPGVIDYYVTETSSFGCISDSSLDVMTVIVKPQPPVVHDVWYCQHFHPAAYLNAAVDSQGSSTLKWYYNSTLLGGTPQPPTDTLPGNMTWWVSEVIQGCESDSLPLTVTIIYKPVFDIATQGWVCQHDSITLAYSGPSLFAPGYTWTLPVGTHFATGSYSFDSMVTVRFDTALLSNYVHLVASDDSGKCSTDDSIRVRVIPQPDMNPHCKPDVCLGDTVMLGLNSESADAYTFTWYIDNTPLATSPAINMVSASSNSGGPYSITWIDSGLHVIMVKSFSEQGCKSLPSFDTVRVHVLPDADFTVKPKRDQLCLEDSALFTAKVQDYRYSYEWSPAHYFDNINSGIIWGRLEQARSIVTLKVTDPYGCVATESKELDPDACCQVWFPGAFTPGDQQNNRFHPLANGYHKFHVFRIANRWGQTIFQCENSDGGWDGTYNGVPQDIGTYFYYLKYDCGGKTLEMKGDVTLIR